MRCRQPERLTGVIRRLLGGAADRAGGADLQTLRHPRGCVGPVLEQFDQVIAIAARHHVERGEVQVLLHGRGDARLVRPEEGVGCARVVFAGPDGAEGVAADAPEGETGHPATDGEPEQAAAAQARATCGLVGRDLRAIGGRGDVVGHLRRAPWS